MGHAYRFPRHRTRATWQSSAVIASVGALAIGALWLVLVSSGLTISWSNRTNNVATTNACAAPQVQLTAWTGLPALGAPTANTRRSSADPESSDLLSPARQTAAPAATAIGSLDLLFPPVTSSARAPVAMVGPIGAEPPC